MGKSDIATFSKRKKFIKDVDWTIFYTSYILINWNLFKYPTKKLALWVYIIELLYGFPAYFKNTIATLIMDMHCLVWKRMSSLRPTSV